MDNISDSIIWNLFLNYIEIVCITLKYIFGLDSVIQKYIL